MRKTTVKLDDIPKELLPVLTSTKHGTIWLNGLKVEAIHIHRENQYRLSTNKGEYRYPVCSDVSVDITT